MIVYNFKIENICLNESGKKPFIEYRKDAVFENSIFVNPSDKILDNYDGSICIAAKNYNSDNVIFFGIRHIDSFTHKYFTMKEIYFEGLTESCDSVMAAARQFKRLLLIINLDVLDPVFYESEYPGGMTVRELLYVVQRIRMMNNLKSVMILGKDKKIIEKLIIEMS